MKVVDLLSQLTTVRYIPNIGNYGDALIHQGTLALFRRFNIKQSDDSNVVIFGGGGNLVPYYTHTADAINSCKQSLGVILPHTIAGDAAKAAIQNFKGRLIVFTREEESFNFVRSFHDPVYIDQDMAFYLDYSLYKKAGEGTLSCFVGGPEEHPKYPATEFDLSNKGNHKSNIDYFLGMISGFEKVETNRLHIAIPAAMMGKQVDFYPGAYYKNKAVYQYSLRELPNVKFIED